MYLIHFTKFNFKLFSEIAVKSSRFAKYYDYFDVFRFKSRRAWKRVHAADQLSANCRPSRVGSSLRGPCEGGRDYTFDMTFIVKIIRSIIGQRELWLFIKILIIYLITKSPKLFTKVNQRC